MQRWRSLALLSGLLVLWAVWAPLCLSHGRAFAAESRERFAHVERVARALEHRLLAPCCYQQTLDTHHSELTTELRRDIRARLAAGQEAAAIEQQLVARYGERIRAVPASSPFESVALAGMLTVLAAGAALWWRARRWVRARVMASEHSEPERDPYDAALDRALDSLDR